MARSLFLAGIFLVGCLVDSAPAARPGPFLDLALGRSVPLHTDVRIVQPAHRRDYTLRAVSFRDRSFEMPLWYSVRAGWRLPRPSWLALGVELIHPKMYARTGDTRRIVGTHDGAAIDTVVVVNRHLRRFDVSHGENYLVAEAIAHRALAGFEGYAGLGLGPVIAHPENVVDGKANRERYELAGLGVLGLLGVRILPTPRLGLQAEYKVSRAALEVSLAEGHARLTERTHHVSAGVTVMP